MAKLKNDEFQSQNIKTPLDSTSATPPGEVKDSNIAVVATPTKWWRGRTFMISAVTVLILLGTAGVSLMLKAYKAAPVVTKSATVKPQVKQMPANKTVFYAQPKKLGDLNFFGDLSSFGQSCSNTQTVNCPNTITENQILYNQIGVTAQGYPIIDVSANQSVSDFEYVALGIGGDNYSILTKLTFSETDSNYPSRLSQLEKLLNRNVSVDTSTTIPELTFPNQITIDGETIELSNGDSYPAGYFINGLSDVRGSFFKSTIASSDMKKIGEEDGITYYEVTVPNIGDSNYQVKEFYGVVGGVFAASYKAQEPLTSATAPTVNWSLGNQTVATSYAYSAGGCGSPAGFVVAKNIAANQFKVTGQGPSKSAIYQLDTSNALFQDYYNDYGDGSAVSDDNLKNLTADQYQAAHGLVFMKNALGEYVAYQRSDLFEGGGCGKPVIYLYPQKTTKVNISVGANVKASDPLYTSNGWRNILAQPSGQLTYGGKIYHSLFWEGIGLGPYPLVTSGTIVPQAKVVATIKDQLQKQGLNAQEISDFLTYWQPKLPTTPYIRLSWLDTEQMNTLAPLQILPKPKTVVRVFLDFEGLEKPRTIAAQTFHTPVRSGFTVVEWGGLLRQSN